MLFMEAWSQTQIGSGDQRHSSGLFKPSLQLSTVVGTGSPHDDALWRAARCHTECALQNSDTVAGAIVKVYISASSNPCALAARGEECLEAWPSES